MGINGERRWWKTWRLGLVLAVVAVFVGVGTYGSTQLQRAVSVELEETIVRSLVADPQVRVTLGVESELPATFRGINGELEISGLPTEYRIEGLAAGDQIARKDRRQLVVYVTLGSRQLARAATRVFFGESVPVTFKGTIFVEVFGFSLDVPIELQEEIVLEE